jgi:hypothetical protein
MEKDISQTQGHDAQDTPDSNGSDVNSDGIIANENPADSKDMYRYV